VRQPTVITKTRSIQEGHEVRVVQEFFVRFVLIVAS
jgi:hypothetical protein